MPNKCTKRTGKCFICGHVRESLKDQSCGLDFDDDGSLWVDYFRAVVGVIVMLGVVIVIGKFIGAL